MSSRIAFALLFAVAAAGQAPQATPGAPPEVDQALRARVDQFFRYHVEGGASLRKAMEMVAEETKDAYFASNKPKILAYEVTGIEYERDFTRARVALEVSRNMVIVAQVVEFTLPMRTSWKIEDGKWMWYQDAEVIRMNPMSEGAGPPNENSENQNALPPELTQPNGVEALARNILRPSSLDKQSVTFRWGQPSEEEVVFLNAYSGAELVLENDHEVVGLSMSLDKAIVKVGENGLVRFRYAPPAGFDAAGEELPKPFFVNLVVVPFNQILRIEIKFVAP